MVRAFIAFLQSVFETAPAGYFRWAPEFEDTEIVITEENPVKVDVLERKPVISVVLGQCRWQGLSLDDLQKLDFTNAQEQHTDMIPGTMSLNCMSRESTESRFIAWQVSRHIWILRKVFIKEKYIHEVGRTQMINPTTPGGALVSGDTEGEWLSTAVMVPFFLQWTDRVTPLKEDWNQRPIHRLQHIEMLLKTRMGIAQPNLTHTQNVGRQLWGTQVNNAGIRPPRRRGREIQQQPRPGAESSPLSAKFKV